MAKKNTLLYLDEDTVNEAKKLDINLSELAMDAIARAVKLRQARQDAESILDNADQLYIPIRLDRLTIKNLGPVHDLEADFEEVNVIVGPNASGKTLLINKLYEALHRQGPSNLPGTIEIEGEISPGEGCVIFDDLLDRYGDELRAEIIKRAAERYEQIIFTSLHKQENVNNIEILLYHRDKREKRDFLMDEIEDLHTKRKILEEKLNYLQKAIKEIEVS